MIVTMKKITLVVLDREREQALTELRRTGVLHIEKTEATSQSCSDLQAQINRLDQAQSFLSEVKIDKKQVLTSVLLSKEESEAVINRIFAIQDEYKEARESISTLQYELDRLSPWGDIDPSDFQFLADKGLYLFPFEMTVSDFNLLSDTVTRIILYRDSKIVRCVLVQSNDLLHESVSEAAFELEMPYTSTKIMREELKKAQELLPVLDAKMREEVQYVSSLENLKMILSAELDFETVRQSMPLIEMGNTDNKAQTSLAWLTGFVPIDQENKIREASQKHGWAFLSSEPIEEDNVPTQIKNNRFVNLISPLLEFLGTVPGYRELDISLWFLLFFGIFFAMIFGDAGYGTLLVLASLGAVFSAIKKGKTPNTGLYMFVYLGLMTVVWGTVTCTWFSLPVSTLPRFLQNISIPAFSNANPDSATNIKVFCFTLGLIQISLAHLIGFIRNIKSAKLLGELGALMMTIGMYFVVLNLVVDAEKYPLTNVVLGLIAVGFVLNFVFINFDGSIGGGILESLKNIITMLLGVVNMFGDIMSYIRLWAVGLAGAAISSTINSMAGPFLGGFIIFAAILILFFGHGLNLVMNALSVIVHGVRLNTLEFSNHLGLTWSGFKYEPFTETVQK